MADILENVAWIEDLIPELEARRAQFVVDTEEVDDELIDVFIDELGRLSGELRQGIIRGDLEMVRMAAHSIKGMGGTIGLPEISVVGQEIERCAKEDRSSDAKVLIDAMADWMKTQQ